MELVYSSIVTGIAIIVSAIISTRSVKKSKYYIDKIEHLTKTREKLAKDWMFFYELETLLLDEIEKHTKQNKEAKKVQVRKSIEDNRGYKINFKPNEIKRFF